VKVCGLRNPADLDAAKGAQMVGFVVGTPSSVRDLPLPVAAKLVRRVPRGVRSVAVTIEVTLSRLQEIVAQLRPQLLQVHGDVAPSDVAALRAALPSTVGLIGVVRIPARAATGGPSPLGPLIDQAGQLRDAGIEMLLLDTKGRTFHGGGGAVHDWDLSAELVRSVRPLPVLLAGGLGPHNVAAAVAQVQPAGVDASSGLETGTGKDKLKVAAFLRAARGGP